MKPSPSDLRSESATNKFIACQVAKRGRPGFDSQSRSIFCLLHTCVFWPACCTLTRCRAFFFNRYFQRKTVGNFRIWIGKLWVFATLVEALHFWSTFTIAIYSLDPTSCPLQSVELRAQLSTQPRGSCGPPHHLENHSQFLLFSLDVHALIWCLLFERGWDYDKRSF